MPWGWDSRCLWIASVAVSGTVGAFVHDDMAELSGAKQGRPQSRLMLALAGSPLDCRSQFGERNKRWKSAFETGGCLGRNGRMEAADRLLKKGLEILAP